MLPGQVQIRSSLSRMSACEQFLMLGRSAPAFEQVRGIAVRKVCGMNALGDAGPLRGDTAGVPDDFVGAGRIHAVAIHHAGKHVVTGFIQRQYSRNASSSLGLSGTLRVALALALVDMDQHELLSMSLAFSCTSSARASRWNTGSSGWCDTAGWELLRSAS